MNPRFDLIDSFLALSLFKQLALIFLLGPLTASIWALIVDARRPTGIEAIRLDQPRRTGSRKAA
jgi:hypothetical protein